MLGKTAAGGEIEEQTFPKGGGVSQPGDLAVTGGEKEGSKKEKEMRGLFWT